MTSHPGSEELARLLALSDSERRQILLHVQACTACRGRFVAGDPSRLFALLAIRPVPAQILGEVTTGVNRALGEGRPERRVQVHAAVAWAAAIVLAALAGLFLAGPFQVSPRGATPEAVAESMLPSEGTPTAGVELLSPRSTAQLVDLTVGDTQVVMIFDEALDL